MYWDLRRLLIAALLVLLAVGSWWLATRPPSVPAAATGLYPQVPDYTIDNFTLTALDPLGRRKYVIEARRLVHYPGQTVSELEQPRLAQFSPGKPPVRSRADSGLLDDDGKAMTLRGHVVITQGDPATGTVTTTHEWHVHLD